MLDKPSIKTKFLFKKSRSAKKHKKSIKIYNLSSGNEGKLSSVKSSEKKKNKETPLKYIIFYTIPNNPIGEKNATDT